MKSVFATMIIVCISFFMIGADMPAATTNRVEIKKHCTGYTIIEAGLALDCHGDTVKLIRRQGYYELAARYETHVLAGEE